MKNLIKTLILTMLMSLSVFAFGCDTQTKKPSINLNGMEDATMEIGTVYTVTAEAINADQLVIEVTAPDDSAVNVDSDNEFRLRYIGEYKITMTAENGKGKAEEKVTVTCRDTQKPVIVVNGGQKTFSYGETCVLPSATITDNDPMLDAQATAVVVSPSGKNVELYNNSFVIEEEGVYEVTYPGQADNGGNVPDPVKYYLYGKSENEVNSFDSEYLMDGVSVNSGNKISYWLNTKDQQYIKSGTGSLKFTVERGDGWGGWPTVYLTNTYYRDMRVYEYITFTLYNPQPYDFTFYVQDYGFKVPANGSVDARLPVYDVINSKSNSDIAAVDTLMFVIVASSIPKEQESFTYYLDEVRLVNYEEPLLKVDETNMIGTIGEELQIPEATLFGATEEYELSTVVKDSGGEIVDMPESGVLVPEQAGEYLIEYVANCGEKKIEKTIKIYVLDDNEYADFEKSDAFSSMVEINSGNNTNIDYNKNGLEVICGKFNGVFAGYHGVKIGNARGDLSGFKEIDITLYNPNTLPLTAYISMVSKNELLGTEKKLFDVSLVIPAGQNATKTVALSGISGLDSVAYISISLATSEDRYGEYETLSYFIKRIILTPYDSAGIEVNGNVPGVTVIGGRVYLPEAYAVGGQLSGEIGVSVADPEGDLCKLVGDEYFEITKSGIYVITYKAVVGGKNVEKVIKTYALKSTEIANFDVAVDWQQIVSVNSGNATSFRYDDSQGMVVTFGKIDGAFAGWQVFNIKILQTVDWSSYQSITFTVTNTSSVAIQPYVSVFGDQEISKYQTIEPGQKVTIVMDLPQDLTNVDHVGIGFSYQQSITAENAALINEATIRVHSVELV